MPNPGFIIVNFSLSDLSSYLHFVSLFSMSLSVVYFFLDFLYLGSLTVRSFLCNEYSYLNIFDFLRLYLKISFYFVVSSLYLYIYIFYCMLNSLYLTLSRLKCIWATVVSDITFAGTPYRPFCVYFTKTICNHKQ